MTRKAPPSVTPAQTSVAQSFREELRVLNAAADDTPTTKEWFTPEFISMITSVGLNLITAATVVGWIDANSAQELTKAITALGAAVGVVGANAFIIWKYLSGRQAVKTEAVRARYQYMEAVAVERMRSTAGW